MKYLNAALPIFFLFSCGDDTYPSKDEEISTLSSMVNDVGRGLARIGFPINARRIELDVQDKDAMSDLFEQLSQNKISDPNSFGDDGRLAFYDANTKTLVFRRGASREISRGYLAHELAHVYQDQKWGLDNIWDKYQNNPTQENYNITQYVIEGHAELARQAYEQSQGSTTEVSSSSIDLGNLLESDCAGCSAQEDSNNWPYSLGLRFMLQQYVDGGWDLAEKSLTELPRSTEQILHPQKLGSDQPLAVKLPDREKASLTVDFQGSMGEAFLFNKLVTLGVPNQDAFLVASGWDGDTSAIHKNSNSELFVWRLIFDREFDALQLSECIKNHPTSGRLSIDGRAVDWIMGEDQAFVDDTAAFLKEYPWKGDINKEDSKSTRLQESEAKKEAANFMADR